MLAPAVVLMLAMRMESLASLASTAEAPLPSCEEVCAVMLCAACCWTGWLLCCFHSSAAWCWLLGGAAVFVECRNARVASDVGNVALVLREATTTAAAAALLAGSRSMNLLVMVAVVCLWARLEGGFCGGGTPATDLIEFSFTKN